MTVSAGTVVTIKVGEMPATDGVIVGRHPERELPYDVDYTNDEGKREVISITRKEIVGVWI